MKASTFPKGFAGGFIGVSIVQDVPINTSASTVDSPILSPNASNQNLPQVMGKNLLLPPTEALPTPFRVKRLLFYLDGYDARCYKELLSGFVQGFRLHFQGAQLDQFSDNLRSAFQHDNTLRSEICEGRIRGPFEHPPFANLKVFPLRVIPKKHPGEYRMIHHLSYKYGGSILRGTGGKALATDHRVLSNVMKHNSYYAKMVQTVIQIIMASLNFLIFITN